MIAYNVAQRRREIGVRVALGARTADVMRLVLGQSAALVGAALAVGIAAAAAVTRVLQRFLYEVRPTDASSFASAALLLGLAALAASYVPARRAARLDPVDAMRRSKACGRCLPTMIRRLLFAALLCLITAAPAVSQPAKPDPEEAAILAVVDRFMDAISTNDPP